MHILIYMCVVVHRVGDLVMNIPFSFPISRNVLDAVFNALSWSVKSVQNKGILVIREEQFALILPAS